MANPATITNKAVALMSIMLASMMLLACGSDSQTGAYRNFGSEGWLYTDTVVSELSDSALVADLAVGIRHTNSYPYSNIWVEVTYSTPEQLCVDTFDIRLADVYGNWHGQGVGVGYQQIDTLVRNVVLDGAHPVTLRHIMRADTVPEIQQAGIVIVKKAASEAAL